MDNLKVAITADLHLRTQGECPERYNALLNILENIKAQNISTIIIAGDLFDRDFHNYSQFESICKNHAAIDFHIIPGNHDTGISNKNIVGDNIYVYTTPTITRVNSIPFLFIPYEEQTKMVEKVIGLEDKITGNEWVLIGHGDFYGGVKGINPFDPGIYMPLSKSNIDTLKPTIVFLGHIHKPFSTGNVHYVGSPCGLDIGEIGKRRFLTFDTVERSVISNNINTDVLYFHEIFIIVPHENEAPLLQQEIRKRIGSWGLEQSEYTKVRVRVEIMGYSQDRSAIIATLKEGFSGLSYYKNEGPLTDKLSSSGNHQLNIVAKQTMDLIDKLQLTIGDEEPDKDMIKIEALKMIYGA